MSGWAPSACTIPGEFEREMSVLSVICLSNLHWYELTVYRVMGKHFWPDITGVFYSLSLNSNCQIIFQWPFIPQLLMVTAVLFLIRHIEVSTVNNIIINSFLHPLFCFLPFSAAASILYITPCLAFILQPDSFIIIRNTWVLWIFCSLSSLSAPVFPLHSFKGGGSRFSSRQRYIKKKRTHTHKAQCLEEACYSPSS